MNYHIRPVAEGDTAVLIEVAWSAFEPVRRSFEQLLGAAIYARIYPDWNAMQREAVEKYCANADQFTVLVADVDGTAVGFIACVVNHETKTGEVEHLAVHADHQNGGIGTALNLAALDAMRDAGMKHVQLGTGGDESHAPARRSYEKAGYTALPLVRYYRDL